MKIVLFLFINLFIMKIVLFLNNFLNFNLTNQSYLNQNKSSLIDEIAPKSYF